MLHNVSQEGLTRMFFFAIMVMQTREVADICQDLIQKRANAQTLAKTLNGERVQ